MTELVTAAIDDAIRDERIRAARMTGITHNVGDSGLLAICLACTDADPHLRAVPEAHDYRGVFRGEHAIAACSHPGHGFVASDWTTCTARWGCDGKPSNAVGLCSGCVDEETIRTLTI